MRISFTLKEIADYLFCPMYYRFVHVDKIPVRSPYMHDEYSLTMRKVIHNMFFMLQDGKEVSLDDMKAHFSSIWLSYGYSSNEFKIYNSKIRDGTIAMLDVFNTISVNPGIPLLINEPYEVPVGNRLITGHIEVARQVRLDRKDVIELISLTSRVNNMYYKLLHRDPNVVMQSYAFRKCFGVNEHRTLMLILNDKNNTRIFRMNENSYSNLEKVISSVCGSIDSEYFYITPNKNCKMCPFVKKCS